MHALPVVIEVDSSLGLPGFSMVGLPDSSVRESRERVVSAIRSSGFVAMNHRLTVNLAPADVRKEGSAFDLALAVGMLYATEQLDVIDADSVVILGELSLDGGVQPIRGALSMALGARALGKRLIVPKANLAEALEVDGLQVVGVNCLRECVELLSMAGSGGVARVVDFSSDIATPHLPNFSSVHGMQGVRRTLEIAAAGWHHFLMVGSPGAGKTLCAQCVPGILAPMTRDEAIETTMIHSCAGHLAQGSGLLRKRPFRTPHHSASSTSLVGGGRNARPGEVSLAHNGLLFLDEFPEFSRSSLEGLRQPLEDGRITVARVAETIEWPARFMLGAAMNPCPCGYHLDPQKQCQCTAYEIQRYRTRISGPMLDRIDLQIHVPPSGVDVLRSEGGESSEKIAARVIDACERQRFRSCTSSVIKWNSRLSAQEIRRDCALNASDETFLLQAAQKMALSARGIFRVLKVARTIADLAGHERIGLGDLGEAIQYRLV